MKVSVLSSGSKGNCTYIETKNHKILIDIGTTTLYVKKCLETINVDIKDIDILLVTHAHIDHVGGIEVFIKKYNPQVYISDEIIKEAKLENIEFNRLIDLNKINDIKISELKLSHDVTDIKGYLIEEDKNSAVYITDTGYVSERILKKIFNKNIYIFESNHDIEKLMNNNKYPHSTKIRILSNKGHLSNKDSSYYLSNLIGDNTKQVFLAHLSEQNNTESLALTTLKKTLKKKNINFNNIDIARQNKMTELIEV